MNKSQMQQFLEQCLDDGIEPDKVFFRFREEYPEALKEIEQIKKPGEKPVRQQLATMTSELAADRAAVCTTKVGERFHELRRKRLDFKVELLQAMEERLAKMREDDPGTDPEAIDTAFTEIQQVVGMLNEIDSSGEREGEAIKAIVCTDLREMQARAAALWPDKVPMP